MSGLKVGRDIWHRVIGICSEIEIGLQMESQRRYVFLQTKSLCAHAPFCSQNKDNVPNSVSNPHMFMQRFRQCKSHTTNEFNHEQRIFENRVYGFYWF